jgi:hypothetical protein
VPFGKYITGTDRRSFRAQTVLDCFKLVAAFNTGYRVEYPFFARFLALCRARGITVPTIGLGSLHSIAPKPIVGIVIIWARHNAKIRAKSLIVSEKNYCNHRARLVPAHSDISITRGSHFCCVTEVRDSQNSLKYIKN